MKKFIDKYSNIDYLFWISFLLFTNPGGILEALGEDSSDGGINITDILFVFMFLCFLRIFKADNLRFHKQFLKTIKFIAIFLIYYFLVFAFFVPQFKDVQGYSLMTTIIKLRYGVINVFLLVFTYFFFLRSYKLFIKYFTVSSIVIICLFLITVSTNLNILPLESADRHFIKMERLFMSDYGLTPIFIHFGVVLLVFKFKIPFKFKILVASLLVFILWLIGLLRREILGTIILFIIASFLFNYIKGRDLIPYKKILQVVFYLILLFFVVKFTFPKYTDALQNLAIETYNVVKYGKTSTGRVDPRLKGGKKELQEKIVNNYIIGTGFDNDWRVSEEDGFEASDYPFLSALAMTGGVGLLMFFPVYVVIIKTVFFDVRYLGKMKTIDINSIELFLMIAFLLHVIYDLIQYINWFSSVSLLAHIIQKRWFSFLGMYLASRKIYYEMKTLPIV